MTLAASFIGAFVFGRIADMVGRKRVYWMVAAIMVVGALGSAVALALLGSGAGHDVAWRVMLGLGAVPAAAVLYLRRKMPESPRYQLQVRGAEERAAREVRDASDGRVGGLAASDGRVGGFAATANRAGEPAADRSGQPVRPATNHRPRRTR